MFHNVLTVEYMLKMRKYTNANYMAGIFVNFALFLGCMIVSFMRIAYLQINDGSVVVQWAQNRFFLLITSVYPGSRTAENGFPLLMADILSSRCHFL